MKKTSGGSLRSLIVLLLLTFVAATEYGLSPGQKLLELTCSLVGLALGEESALAATPTRNNAFRVTKSSQKEFDSTYGRYKIAVSKISSSSKKSNNEPKGLKEKSVAEVTSLAALDSAEKGSSRDPEPQEPNAAKFALQ